MTSSEVLKKLTEARGILDRALASLEPIDPKNEDLTDLENFRSLLTDAIINLSSNPLRTVLLVVASWAIAGRMAEADMLTEVTKKEIEKLVFLKNDDFLYDLSAIIWENWPRGEGGEA